MGDLTKNLKQAVFWENEKATNESDVRCKLCPRYCLIKDEQRGLCQTRLNRKGTLYSVVYGHPVASNVDPIEKKPFAEFYPGTRAFSLGTFGCNLRCVFCQNYELSRGKPEINPGTSYISPQLIIDNAKKYKCKSIAFTYNEPTVFAEYAIDIAKLARQQGLKSVIVSNGYINDEPANELFSLIDAANIDMKAFSEDFYKEMLDGELAPVLNSIKKLYDLDKHVEITNLVIPQKNDSKEMINSFLDWVEKNLDKNVPIHFSAFHPMYKYKNSSRTSPETLYEIKKWANNRGFTHIYLGNI